jgi:hypothetical protein
MKQQQRVAMSLRAVRVMRTVVADKAKLEFAWERECGRSQLRPPDKRLLRDVCSGTLRWLEYYGRLVDYVAPMSVADDLDLKLLTASTVYQSENMQKAPDRATLRRVAADCCVQLDKPQAANSVKELCRRILEMEFEERRHASTPASAYSLPKWLHRRLMRDRDVRRWLETSGHLLLERPDFLNVCVPTEAYGGAREYAQLLRRAEGMQAQPSDLAPLGVLIQSRPRDVGALPGIASGVVHVQDAVQQFSCSLLRPLREGERVLDACAAPGGKSRSLLHHQPLASLTALDANGRKVAAMRRQLHGGSSAADAERGVQAGVQCGAKNGAERGARALAEGGAMADVEVVLMEHRRQRIRVLHADVNECASEHAVTTTAAPAPAASHHGTSAPLHPHATTTTTTTTTTTLPHHHYTITPHHTAPHRTTPHHTPPHHHHHHHLHHHHHHHTATPHHRSCTPASALLTRLVRIGSLTAASTRGGTASRSARSSSTLHAPRAGCCARCRRSRLTATRPRWARCARCSSACSVASGRSCGRAASCCTRRARSCAKRTMSSWPPSARRRATRSRWRCRCLRVGTPVAASPRAGGVTAPCSSCLRKRTRVDTQHCCANVNYEKRGEGSRCSTHRPRRCQGWGHPGLEILR